MRLIFLHYEYVVEQRYAEAEHPPARPCEAEPGPSHDQLFLGRRRVEFQGMDDEARRYKARVDALSPAPPAERIWTRLILRKVGKDQIGRPT